jgi:phosphoglycerol transferase MdoB-like AlkP superfamily enzyme
MPFVLGNMMSSLGYKADGFHNHTYTYYSRDKSHPNFGYGWHGVGNWKEATFTSAWPKSDRELAVNTLSYITSDKPFHLYYMTVSGHAYHTGNKQASKHKSYVKSLNLGYTTNGAISYVASQYEVELMVAELCAELERKGELENTVFVMAPDHYPYSIVGKTNDKNQAVDDDAGTMEALSELYGLPVDNIFLNFDLYRAPLIIWSPSMEAPVKVDKVCSAIDVLPTVLNLFGAEYDSRLIMGRDILSDSDGFVILNCSNASGISSSNNWVTKYGIYNSRTKTFERNPKYTQAQIDKLLSMGYVDAQNALLKKMRTYSNYILENDYYGKVFGK